jgi:choline dehydrogenase-like flavoprotein
MCRPFEPLDFQARPWVPHSGWPLSRDVLEPYYRRAHLACGLEPDRYDDRAWNRYLAEFDRLRHGGVLPKVVQLTLVQFGRRFRPLLERSQTVRLLLHANAHELLPDPAVGTVRRVEVRTLSGNHFFVEARAYVLACGGIENARILLASDSVTAKGLGNGRDLVGRFYMDHPATESCALALFFDEKAVRSLMEAREKRALLGLTLSDAVQREQGLTSNVLYFTPPKPWKTFWMETVHGETAEFLRRLGQDRAAYGSICRMLSEQVPNPDSRVTLTQERDRLGMRRVLVDSRLHDLNRHTSWTAPGLYARGFARGYVNPTLTIVALSLRLAEHLRRVLV